MGKSTTVFFCNSCGNETSKWAGQCPACKEWNTLVEEPKKATNKAIKSGFAKMRASAKTLKEITADVSVRTDTGLKELNRVLGGGIVTGSVVLVGGDPGIGKSTLLLQICQNINQTILYISGEESDTQIKMRAERLGITTDNLLLLAENNLDEIEENIASLKPNIVIVDSIQTVYRQEMSSAPGSVSQIREATASLTTIAKSMGTTMFIVGHVTKDGSLAGPKVLEHLVDTVLYFEGDRYESYRILRAVKNRFGSTNEIGVFEMVSNGFKEVLNPSGLFVSETGQSQKGCSIACIIEGTRPVLCEVQSLVSTTTFGNPRRMAAGIDNNRIVLLLAVLEKKLHSKVSDKDVYLNVVGGLKVDDRASDLSVMMSILSSLKEKEPMPKTVFIGEISLTGELRNVSNIDKRLSECEKLGFENVFLPASCKHDVKTKMNLVFCHDIFEAEKKAF